MSIMAMSTNSFAQESEKPYKNQLISVENKLKSGNLTDALLEMEKITEKYPDAAEIFYGKAILLGQMGNVDGALENARLAFDKDKSLLYGNYIIDILKDKNQLTDALPIAEVLYDKFSANSGVVRNYIALLADSKNLDQAKLIYSKELNKGHQTDTLDLVMAESYLLAEKFSDAKALLLPLQGKSKLQQAYSMLAFVYGKEKNDKESIAVLENGINLTKEPILYLDLADAYKNTGKILKSFEALKKAFDSDKVPFADKYRIMLNVMNPNAKDFSKDQVYELANSLVLHHPRMAESHMLKGEVLWGRGNIGEARSLFLTAIGINPRQIDAWRMLINADLSLNQPDAAIQHGQEALSANPNNTILLYFTGIGYMVKEDLTNARALLESALNVSENENPYVKSMIYSSLGDLYHQMKLESASDVAYEEAIQLDSTNVSAMNNYAYYLAVRNKKLDEAATYAKQANEIDPSSGTFQDTYAWVLFKQNKYKEALVWIEKSIKSTKEPSSVLYEHYGDILSKLNKTSDALKNWQKALTISTKEEDTKKIQEKIKLKKYVD